MAISEVCKFELKAQVDRLQREKEITRGQAIAIVADECDLLKETARKMDQRARKELGQIVPQESKTTEITTDLIENRKPQGGGLREGAGRKPNAAPVYKEQDGSDLACEHSEVMARVSSIITSLKCIPSSAPDYKDGLWAVLEWVEKRLRLKPRR